ncbi:TolC family protein [Paucihalobacter ruber]|uniref:TolC family protein n=2 Tax=Paucihalobacter ruber TaxID=2567861 RepID=A0A506PQV8_9FLAO|nr:TolC family protein [Paucihalobacter ruber]
MKPLNKMKATFKYIILVVFVLSIGNQFVYSQTLEDYLKEAAENNPELKSSYAGFEAALEKAPQVASLPDPSLSVSAFGRMIETRLGAQEARFSLVQMFPWFGTLKAQEDAVIAAAQTRFYQYINQRSLLFVQVKSRYAELYALERIMALKEENLAILENYRELALSGFRSGNAPMVNVVKVDMEREALITEIELLKDKKKPMEVQFNLLLNREKSLSVPILDSLNLEQNLSVMKEPKNEPLFEKHPTLVALESEKLALDSRITAIEKDGLPKFGVGIDYSIISKRTDANPENNGQDAIMPMVSVTLPIFRKKYRAAKKEVEFMQVEVAARRKAQQNNLESSFQLTRYELNQAEKLLKLYKSQLERINQATRLYVAGFANNTADFEEILTMNQQKILIQTQQLEALKNGFIAQAQLEYLGYKTE